jgi:putative FmdB family regulatory protein
MALFEYECKECGCEFEELVLVNSKDDTQFMACKKCGKPAERKMSRFSSVITGGTSNEPVDMTIGRESEKRWQMHYDKQNERRKDKTLQTFELPKSKDGKFMPVMGLGDKTEKEKRQEYSSALKEHVQERERKGIPQFSGIGPF